MVIFSVKLGSSFHIAQIHSASYLSAIRKPIRRPFHHHFTRRVNVSLPLNGPAVMHQSILQWIPTGKPVVLLKYPASPTASVFALRATPRQDVAVIRPILRVTSRRSNKLISFSNHPRARPWSSAKTVKKIKFIPPSSSRIRSVS